MSIADLYNIKRAIQRDEEWRPQSELSTQAVDGKTLCILHSDCATSFAKSSIRSAINESTVSSSSRLIVDEAEAQSRPDGGRKSILHILGRTAGLDLNGSQAPSLVEAASEGEKDDDATDDPTPDLVSPAQPSAEYLEALAPLLRQASHRLDSVESEPEAPPSNRLRYNIAAVVAAYAFIINDLDVESLSSLLSISEEVDNDFEQQKPLKLLIPVIKSILADLVPFLTAVSPRNPSKGKAKVSTPKHVDPRTSQDLALVLQDAEDITLFLLSRLQPLIEHTEVAPNPLLRQMLTRTIEITAESKVIALATSTSSKPEANFHLSDLHQTLATRIQSRAKMLHVLSDLFAIFASSTDEAATQPSVSKTSDQDLNSVQRKLLFYGMASLMLPSGEEHGSKGSMQGCGLADVVSDLKKEVDKLEKEADDRAGLDGLHAWEQQRSVYSTTFGLVAARTQVGVQPGTALISSVATPE
ncbi:hypothetical protein OC861_005341 [Tilletia horrida]|nr:hypothetical protein OC861_005341 [Tilletia horrida]